MPGWPPQLGSVVHKCGFMEADSPEKGEVLLFLLSTCGQNLNQSCLENLTGLQLPECASFSCWIHMNRAQRCASDRNVHLLTESCEAFLKLLQTCCSAQLWDSYAWKQHTDYMTSVFYARTLCSFHIAPRALTSWVPCFPSSKHW